MISIRVVAVAAFSLQVGVAEALEAVRIAAWNTIATPSVCAAPAAGAVAPMTPARALPGLALSQGLAVFPASALPEPVTRLAAELPASGPLAARAPLEALVSLAPQFAGPGSSAAVDRLFGEARGAGLAPVAPGAAEAPAPEGGADPSPWRFLSADAVKVLGVLRELGMPDGYGLMRRTGLAAESVGRALDELRSYPFGALATVAGSLRGPEAARAMAALAPSAAGTVDLILNPHWGKVSGNALRALAALGNGGAMDGYRLMRDAGLKPEELEAALQELRETPAPLVIVAGDAFGARIGGIHLALRPSAAGFVKALVAYRRP
ncbi:MAG: hypothetical protein HY554_09800 [Elusimicrobia bacterium]|nr:hypothetical protein [Elusimicrobiota bacterium]